MIRRAILVLLMLAALTVLAAYPFRWHIARSLDPDWDATARAFGALPLSGEFWWRLALSQPDPVYWKDIETERPRKDFPGTQDAAVVLDGWGHPIWVARLPGWPCGTRLGSAGPDGVDDGGDGDDIVVTLLSDCVEPEVVEWSVPHERQLTGTFGPFGPFVPLAVCLLLTAAPAVVLVRHRRECWRPLRVALLCVFCLTMIAAAIAWPLSHRMRIERNFRFGPERWLSHSAGGGPAPQLTAFFLQLVNGRLQFQFQLGIIALPPLSPPRNTHVEYLDDAKLDFSFGGVVFDSRGSTTPGWSFYRVTWASMPVWMILAASASGAAFLLAWDPQRRARRRQRLGLCPTCGYDLTGNESGRCPECGAEVR